MKLHKLYRIEIRDTENIHQWECNVQATSDIEAMFMAVNAMAPTKYTPNIQYEAMTYKPICLE